MDKYYYFASQLPFLRFPEKSFVDEDFFLKEALKWLSPRDMGVLSGLDINDFKVRGIDPPFLRRYKDFEYRLRYDLSLLRRPQEGRYTSSRLRQVLEGRNPLEAEKELMRLRWEFIEEQELDHYSDMDFFIAYFLKLQILKRFFSFNKDIGSEKFRDYSRISEGDYA